MKKRITSLFLLLSTAAMIITGCGKDTSNTAGELTGDKKSYISSLENGVIYVRDQENNCTPVYFGNATFEEETTPQNPDDSRVMWFKTDFENIPTLYKGDSLIMFTIDEIEEKMTFERFEYFGYTIGICGMEELKSGRYKIYTDPDKNNTYPNGDTDEILKLSNNSVILESIGGIQIRSADDEASEEVSTFLTRCGTIKGLNEGETYNVEIYEGSVYHNYTFTADVIALGSMETCYHYNYEFETANLINIEIPEFFNSGYYLINGVGMFRYVNGDSYDENTQFNTANVDPGDEGTVTVTQADINGTTELAQTYTEELASSTTTKFNVKTTGTVTVNVSFTIPGNYGEGDGLEDVIAVIETPSGGTIQMITNTSDGSVKRTFKATEIGEYVIKYYNLDVRVPHLTIE